MCSITSAEWASQAHIDRANAAVAEHLQRSGFDPQATFARLGVKADLGIYMEFWGNSRPYAPARVNGLVRYARTEGALKLHYSRAARSPTA